MFWCTLKVEYAYFWKPCWFSLPKIIRRSFCNSKHNTPNLACFWDSVFFSSTVDRRNLWQPDVYQLLMAAASYTRIICAYSRIMYKHRSAKHIPLSAHYYAGLDAYCKLFLRHGGPKIFLCNNMTCLHESKSWNLCFNWRRVVVA